MSPFGLLLFSKPSFQPQSQPLVPRPPFSLISTSAVVVQKVAPEQVAMDYSHLNLWSLSWKALLVCQDLHFGLIPCHHYHQNSIPVTRDLPQWVHFSSSSSPCNHLHNHPRPEIEIRVNLIPNFLALLRSMRTIRVMVVLADFLREWVKHRMLASSMKNFLALKLVEVQD
jgi:hypothetical protein